MTICLSPLYPLILHSHAMPCMRYYCSAQVLDVRSLSLVHSPFLTLTLVHSLSLSLSPSFLLLSPFISHSLLSHSLSLTLFTSISPLVTFLSLSLPFPSRDLCCRAMSRRARRESFHPSFIHCLHHRRLPNTSPMLPSKGSRGMKRREGEEEAHVAVGSA